MKRSGNIEGIGGWLLLFLLVYGAGAPLLALFHLLTTLSDARLIEYLGARRFRLLMVFECMIRAFYVLACWYPVARLVFVRRWSSVRVAVACLWLTTPLLLLVQAALTALLRWGSFDAMLAYALSEISVTLWAATAFLWTVYLLRSKRVARTYARPGFAAASAADAARVFA